MHTDELEFPRKYPILQYAQSFVVLGKHFAQFVIVQVASTLVIRATKKIIILNNVLFHFFIFINRSKFKVQLYF